jgi:hypothetical protein
VLTGGLYAYQNFSFRFVDGHFLLYDGDDFCQCHQTETDCAHNNARVIKVFHDKLDMEQYIIGKLYRSCNDLHKIIIDAERDLNMSVCKLVCES